MRKILTFSFLLGHAVVFAQTDSILTKYLSDSVDIIKSRIDKKIIPGRYMEQTLVSSTDTLKGWEGVTVSLYEYSVGNPRKTARVYMANADSKKLAAWVISTCYLVTGKVSRKNSDYLIKSIQGASGGQFPVRGIVLEDMNGKGFYPYAFIDGVTVFLKKDIENEFDKVILKNVKSTGKYARIISTTRENFAVMFPDVNTDKLKWLDVVSHEYKSALASDINTLMVAWAKGKIK